MRGSLGFAVFAAMTACASAVELSDFATATNRAVQSRRALVGVFVNNDCLFCRRLEKSCSSPAFRKWSADKAFDVAWFTGPTNSPACKFCSESPNVFADYPVVAVWVPHGDGSAYKTNFVGRRESMPVTDARTLAECLMLSLDGILGSGDNAAEIGRLIKANTKQVSARCNFKPGASGSVETYPKSGVLSEDGPVVLLATPGRGSLFVGWKAPGGGWHSFARRINLRMSDPAGAYTAEFTTASNCAPARVSNTNVVLKAKLGQPFSHVFDVDDDARPLVFRGKMPPGLSVITADGEIRGQPRRAGVFEPTVFVSSPQRRETFSFKIRLEVEE